MSNALCVVSHADTVDTRDQSTSHASMVQILCYAMSILLIQTCTHISIHVNIQQIFNPEKVLES